MFLKLSFRTQASKRVPSLFLMNFQKLQEEELQFFCKDVNLRWSSLNNTHCWVAHIRKVVRPLTSGQLGPAVRVFMDSERMDEIAALNRYGKSLQMDIDIHDVDFA